VRVVPQSLATLICTIAALLLSSCSRTETGSKHGGDSHVAHWGYAADNGPATWGSMNSEWALCAKGRKQSPIDLTNPAITELPAVDLDRPDDGEFDVLTQAGVIGALDNGHTIQVNSKTGEKLTVGGKAYALVQFHFHAPSEHTVDGRHFPMEMHFVHQAADGALAVVGVLVQEGAPNPGIAPLWAQLAEAPGTETAVEIRAEFAEPVFPNVGAGFYHYVGSLTTPPCSEGVQWYVRKTFTSLSKEQIAEFKAVYDHNNRPVQGLNERALYLDENPTVSIH
jgi:carbonic anhydrase